MNKIVSVRDRRRFSTSGVATGAATAGGLPTAPAAVLAVRFAVPPVTAAARFRYRFQIRFVPYEDVFPRGSMEEMFHRVPSIEKIGDALGWAPTSLLDEILDDVVEYERGRVETPA